MVLEMEVYTGDEPLEVRPFSDKDMKELASKNDGSIIYERREEESEPVLSIKEYGRFLRRWKKRPAR